jgi:hypothetical protein
MLSHRYAESDGGDQVLSQNRVRIIRVCLPKIVILILMCLTLRDCREPETNRDFETITKSRTTKMSFVYDS